MRRPIDAQNHIPALPDHSPATARSLLKSIFGYDEFWPLQEEIIARVLAGLDTLVVMPTGGGKSLCFQLPALLFDGLTLVISPLISLMQDQVDALQDLGVPAAFLNSTLDYIDYIATAERVRSGEIKLLYTSPETLQRPETLVLLDQCQLDCIAIDEAHCISSWGHDFRPEYRQLAPLRARYIQAVCIALTATATPRVQDDIEQMLGFDASARFVSSFDRPNLYLGVEPRLDGVRQVLAFLQAHQGEAGIIYCSTRNQVDALAAELQARGFSALPYHAGMDAATREQYQRRFSRDDAAIIVATIAFGMGIDKSNVRFVLHYNLPQNVESYYQEIGRAGRDGVRADCLLLYNQSDVITVRHFIDLGAESERMGRSARLNAMVRYTQSRECRRKPLLAYFGESYAAESCGMCDRCQAETEAPEMEDVTIAAQKFLSCIIRTGQIFGPAHIIKILRGSQAQAVLRRGHERLSTYGIGQEYSARQWQRLANLFIEEDLLVQDIEHGSLKLTDKGYAVLRGEKVYAPVEEEIWRGSEQMAGAEYDALLFGTLSALRKGLAEASDVPPYVVFSDRSLQEMAIYFPQSPASFLAINGVGERKLERYGEVFLAAIAAHCVEHNLSERPKAAAISRPVSLRPTSRRRFEEVGELFAAGQTIADLQELYGVRRGTIISHLDRYLQNGGAIDGGRFVAESPLSPPQQQAVLDAFAEFGPAQLRPVYDALNEQVDWDDLRLLRLYYLSQ